MSWLLPEDLDEARVEAAVFPPAAPPAVESQSARTPPDFAAIHEQLRGNKYVTLQLLWKEYRQVQPDGYRYSRFSELYQRWRSKLDLVLRQEHKAGEKMFVDWGATIPVHDRHTGVAWQAPLFVAALGASSYTWAEATRSADGGLAARSCACVRWHEQIGDPTAADGILDRLVHNAHASRCGVTPCVRIAASRAHDFATMGLLAQMTSIPADHPLIGTWITSEEDSNTAFVFSVENNQFQVSGFCRSDGEEFEITEVKWDGKALSFVARMPSTDTMTKNVFRVRHDGMADLELTVHDVWKKKDVKPGETPEAWRSS